MTLAGRLAAVERIAARPPGDAPADVAPRELPYPDDGWAWQEPQRHAVGRILGTAVGAEGAWDATCVAVRTLTNRTPVPPVHARRAILRCGSVWRQLGEAECDEQVIEQYHADEERERAAVFLLLANANEAAASDLAPHSVYQRSSIKYRLEQLLAIGLVETTGAPDNTGATAGTGWPVYRVTEAGRALLA
jgi:hypothetical protein